MYSACSCANRNPVVDITFPSLTIGAPLTTPPPQTSHITSPRPTASPRTPPHSPSHSPVLLPQPRHSASPSPLATSTSWPRARLTSVSTSMSMGSGSVVTAPVGFSGNSTRLTKTEAVASRRGSFISKLRPSLRNGRIVGNGVLSTSLGRLMPIIRAARRPRYANCSRDAAI